MTLNGFCQQIQTPFENKYSFIHQQIQAKNLNLFSSPDTLKPVLNLEKCGLNYAKASILLGKKMAVYGLPYYGVDQPAPMNITGIVPGAKIEKAYVWWDLTGTDSTGQVIIKNPGMVTDTFAGTLIGRGNRCWGPSSAFRADVTSIIQSNGTYTISGLPTDTTFLLNDVNGATLFIIYSDSLANFAGHIKIDDGYKRALNDTIYESITNLNVTGTYTGKAFMIVGDFENQPGNSLKMNNGPFLGVVQDYWDFEEKNTAYTLGQTSSTFGVSSPNDCSNLICIGAYFKEPYSLTAPTINQVLDTLSSTIANSYQWALNGVAINGANSQTYVVNASGNYSVIVSYTNSICYIASSNLNVIACQDKIQPNINVINDSMWTDSVNYQIQWFYNGLPITGATGAHYTATLVGNYFVHVTDTIGGCIANSDTIYNSFAGMDQRTFHTFEATILPNPNSGDFNLTITSSIPTAVHIYISTLNGESLYSEHITIASQQNTSPIHLNQIAAGVYLVKIVSDYSVCVKKIVVK